MMDRKILISEEAYISLSARSELQMYMIEVLASFFIYHNIGQGHQEKLLDDMEAVMSKIVVPRAATERDAIVTSDIAIQLQTEGANMVKRLRARLNNGLH